MSSEHELLPWWGDGQLRMTDAELISGSVGQPEYFSLPFRRHAPALQRYAVRRLGPAKADDVVAETFLQAFRQRECYHVDASPNARPWLYGIATNLIGRQRRAEAASADSSGMREHRGGLVAAHPEESPAAHLPHRHLGQMMLLLGYLRQCCRPPTDLLGRRPTHGLTMTWSANAAVTVRTSPILPTRWRSRLTRARMG